MVLLVRNSRINKLEINCAIIQILQVAYSHKDVVNYK